MDGEIVALTPGASGFYVAFPARIDPLMPPDELPTPTPTMRGAYRIRQRIKDRRCYLVWEGES